MRQLYTMDEPYRTPGELYQMRRRRVEFWGYCGWVHFPIVWTVLEARRVERRWWGFKAVSDWYRAGPETYTPIS